MEAREKTVDDNEKDYLDKKFEEYFAFRKLDRPIPVYVADIDNKLSQVAQKQQFSIKASTECTNGHLKLHLPENFMNKNMDAVLYHEFTHILDLEKYCVKDNKSNVDDDGRYKSIVGYTEYHAAQIETLKLIKENIIDVQAGTILYKQRQKDEIKKSFLQHLTEYSGVALEKLSEDGCQENENDFLKAIGLLFNYWGIRSIFVMYADDKDSCLSILDNEKFEKIKMDLSSGCFKPIDEWDTWLYGILNEKQIKKVRDDFLKLFKIKFKVDQDSVLNIFLH